MVETPEITSDPMIHPVQFILGRFRNQSFLSWAKWVESFLNPAAADCAAPREAIHSNLSLPSKIRLVLPPLAYLSRKLEQSPISKAKPRQELYLMEPEQELLEADAQERSLKQILGMLHD